MTITRIPAAPAPKITAHDDEDLDDLEEGEVQDIDDLIAKLNQEQRTKDAITQFKIIVDKGENGLGVDLFKSMDTFVMIKTIKGGTIHDWNKAHPEAKVFPADRIVAVNGKHGNGAMLAALIRDSSQLEMVIQRPIDTNPGL
jgi:hypothetical protein